MSDVTHIPAPTAAPTLTNAPLNVPAGTTVVPPPPSVSAPGAMPPPMPGLPGMPPLTIPQATTVQAAPVATTPAPPAQVVAETPAPPVQTTQVVAEVPPVVAEVSPVVQAAPVAEIPAPAQAAPVATIPAPPPVQQVLVPAQHAPAQALASAQQTAPVPFDEDGFPIASTISEAMNALGFEGVSFDGYGIVPNITLVQGEFNKDGQVMPSEFMVKINGSRNKYLFAYGPQGGNKDNSGLCYSYDKVNDANGDRTVADLYAAAAAQNQPVTETHYYEVDAVLLETGEAVKLSVPVRGSGSAFARFLTQCAAARKRPQDAQVLIKRGEKVTKVQHSFYPWCFEIVGWYR